jgi:hypothetical protein
MSTLTTIPGNKTWELPPLILHPFHERVPPSALLENSKAALMLSGLIPGDGTEPAVLKRRLLGGRHAEMRMLFFLGKDVLRWMEQCLEWAERIPELAAVTEDVDAVTIGATVTHAAVEDDRVADPTGGFLRRVAHGIAYRAVRTRGTIGGSLAHADPAADWLSCLTALGAQVVVAGAGGTRRINVESFVRGAMETELAGDELLVAVRVPRFSRAARTHAPTPAPSPTR